MREGVLPHMTRRTFFHAPAAAAASVPLAAANDKLAIQGGAPVRSAKFPSWPRFNQLEENALLDTLRSGHWGRTTGKRVDQFEDQYARLTGSKHCLATANGTSALIASLNALDIGPGDEVLLSPYTFVATLNVVLLQHALPVFTDTDVETFQMDARGIAQRVSGQSAAIIPVHVGGAPADLDKILPEARKYKLRVIEDACQAHLAEWRGKKVGTLGDCGCFSFQASKNLNSGEGGALITNDEQLMSRAYSFHSNGRAWKADALSLSAYASNGANLRLTDFQAALLMAQMTRIEEQARTREQNAAYLTKMLKSVPGIQPARLADGCTRNAWHLYMLRYDPAAFEGVPRKTFLKALAAEGIPGASGYTPLNKEPFIERVISSRHYRRIYGEARLKLWREKNQCPGNDKLCEQAVWFTQTMLLGPKSDMDQIAEAITKIQRNAGALKALKA